jgi:hypothetical protein
MKDSIDFLYLILEPSGRCRRIVDSGTEAVDGLASLLRDGWRPVRETPFSGSSSSGGQVLLLLERDARDPKGFGFRT